MTQEELTPPHKATATPGVTAARAASLVHRTALPARYGYPIAIIGTAITLGLTILLAPYLERTVYLLFWPLVFALAAYTGIGPAVLASILAVLSVDYYLIPPLHEIGATDPADLLSSALFIFAALVISTLVKKRRQAELEVARVAETNAELALQLEEQAVELESQLDEAQAMSLELEQTGAELEEEREEAEKAAAFTRGVIEAITDPFIVQDVDWRFTYINAAAGNQFFRSRHATSPDGSSMIGRVVWDVYPDILGTKFEREMRRAAEERVPTQFEEFYPESGRWQALSCYPLADGGIAIQWKDVTARRKAEEATRYLDSASALLTAPLDTDERLKGLAALVVPDFADWCGIHLLDEQGTPQQVAVAHVDPDKIKFAHELSERYPPRMDDPYGMPNVIRTGQPELIREITDEMIVAGARDEEHLRITRELGLRSAMIVPLAVHDNVFGALTMVSAESRRHYSEDDLALASELARRAAYSIDNARQHQAALKAQEKAESADRAKSQFLAAMSHELRTPLNAIAGYIDLILLGIRGPVTEEQKIDLERVRTAQRHLLSLIGDVLDFSRLEAGQVNLHTTRVALEPVLTEVVLLLEPQMRAHKLRLEYVRPADDVTMLADADRIRQILLNLITNAIKYTEPGGSIAVQCERVNGRVHIHVIDSGIGIDPAEMDRIFQPFVQVHRSFNTPISGVGLGLTISRELARAMQGELHVTSTPREGSTFTLDVPEGPAA